MEALGESVALLIVVIAFGVGLLGSFMPVVPGTLLVWGATLFYAWLYDGFDTFSPFVFVLITLIGLVAGTADIWLPLLGAKKTGASWRTLAVGLIGGLLGTFLLPVPIFGTVIGYGAGVLLAEYVRHGALRPAWRATLGGVVGWGLSAAVELLGCIVMILLFFTQA